ncbi:MAG: integrase, partial [Hyphomicrobiaceae bacterium]|nr:integrase [Hyphomicrobiaceae bacterium]
MADDGQGSSAAAGDDDLPDIVDVVMEMGRDPQPAVTQAPSPLPVMTVETRLPGHLQGLADRARDYVEAASSANTRRAYASDWKHFAGWCRRQGVETVPPDPRTVGLYITALAAGTASGDKKSVSTIERRLSSLSWNFSQRGQPLDRKDRHIATVMAGIRNKHASPP